MKIDKINNTSHKKIFSVYVIRYNIYLQCSCAFKNIFKYYLASESLSKQVFVHNKISLYLLKLYIRKSTTVFTNHHREYFQYPSNQYKWRVLILVVVELAVAFRKLLRGSVAVLSVLIFVVLFPNDAYAILFYGFGTKPLPVKISFIEISSTIV